jgi:hypothetical protein
MDWATREATKCLREAEEASNAVEKSVRDEKLKDVRGMEPFEQLHAWMTSQAESFNEQVGKRMLQAEDIKLFGGVASHHFFKISDVNHERSPMKISYTSAPHEITVDCGAGQKRYSLTIGPSGNVLIETPYRQARTIDEIGEELMSFWRSTRL